MVTAIKVKSCASKVKCITWPFKMRHYLDNQLKIDFTDIQLKQFIQCPSKNFLPFIGYFGARLSISSAMPNSLHIPATRSR